MKTMCDLKHVSTTDLIQELLNRHKEAIFIGYLPPPNIYRDRRPPSPDASRYIDVVSKLDQTGAVMGGVLHGILSRLLHQISVRH